MPETVQPNETSNDMRVAKFDNTRNTDLTPAAMEDLKSIMMDIIKGGYTVHKTVEEAVTAVLTGKEVGMGVMTSINNIHIINDRPSLSINAMQALVLRAGIAYEMLKDYEICEYRYQTNQTPPQNYTEEQKAAGKIPANVKYRKIVWNRITEIRFTRMLRLADGTWFKMVHTQKFTRLDAMAMELLGRDQWIKQESTMAQHRCFSKGSRFIANDCLLGCYLPDEVQDIKEGKDPDVVPVKVNSNPTPVTTEYEDAEVLPEESTETTTEENKAAPVDSKE